MNVNFAKSSNVNFRGVNTENLKKADFEQYVKPYWSELKELGKKYDIRLSSDVVGFAETSSMSIPIDGVAVTVKGQNRGFFDKLLGRKKFWAGVLPKVDQEKDSFKNVLTATKAMICKLSKCK